MSAGPTPARKRPVRRIVGRAARAAMIQGIGRATASRRPLPDFVIVGAQRAGTTSLWAWLVDHPSVLPPVFGLKGVHYFDTAYDRGLTWYRAHFPTARRRARVEARTGAAVTGEASPYYLFHPAVPQRMARDLPAHTRFVVLLRDPVARAVSHYHHMVLEGEEDAPSLEAALDLEEARLAGADELLVASRGARHGHHQHHSYIARGHYAPQLRRLFDAVGRERVLVRSSDAVFSRPREVLREVQEFVGIDPALGPDPGPGRNAGRYPDVSDHTRQRLEATYKTSNEELAELLGERGF